MLIIDIGYIQGQNGEDLSKLVPQPNDSLSFFVVKHFNRSLSGQYRRRFTITIWTPNDNPGSDSTVKILETINADDFDKYFYDYNQARVIFEDVRMMRS
jgi:hypothetical protein